jgi:lipopolysaccharide export system permease protein
LCFVCAVLLFLVIDFVGNSRVWLSRPSADRTAYYLNYLPYIAYLVCPIALLMAAAFSVGNMARHLELVALRAAGVSISRILSSLLLAGALFSAGMFWFQDRVLPEANHRRFRIQEPASGDFSGGDPRERSRYLYTGRDGTQLYLQHYHGSRREGANVTALRLRDGAPVLRVDASALRWDSGWKFLSGTRREFRGDSVRAERFGAWRMETFVDRPEDLLDDRAHPDEMGMEELQRRIEVLRRNGEPPHALQTHWHFRIASALVNFFMAWMGAALAVHTVRSGLARNFGVALLIAFLYYVALRLGLVMGENGGLPPAAAAWFGNLVFLPAGLFLWWRAVRV